MYAHMHVRMQVVHHHCAAAQLGIAVPACDLHRSHCYKTTQAPLNVRRVKAGQLRCKTERAAAEAMQHRCHSAARPVPASQGQSNGGTWSGWQQALCSGGLGIHSGRQVLHLCQGGAF